MSRENVELIRRSLDAFNRVGASGDLTALVQVQREFADPAIEYTPVVEGMRICGHEDLLDYWSMTSSISHRISFHGSNQRCPFAEVGIPPERHGRALRGILHDQ